MATCAIRFQASSVAFNDPVVIPIRFAELKIKLDIMFSRILKLAQNNDVNDIMHPCAVIGRRTKVVSCQCQTTLSDMTRLVADLSIRHSRPSRHVEMVKFPVTSPRGNEIGRQVRSKSATSWPLPRFMSL